MSIDYIAMCIGYGVVFFGTLSAFIAIVFASIDFMFTMGKAIHLAFDFARNRKEFKDWQKNHKINRSAH